MNKYRNIKTIVDGIKFDSKKEARFYITLKSLQSAKKVISFIRQVKYPISVNGVKICTYIADFLVTWEYGRSEVIDVKGIKTPIYRLKKKLVKACYNIDIVEM